MGGGRLDHVTVEDCSESGLMLRLFRTLHGPQTHPSRVSEPEDEGLYVETTEEGNVTEHGADVLYEVCNQSL